MRAPRESGAAMEPDLELLDALTRHRVPFVVIGGHAVTAHGYVRATEDVDVVWLRSPESEENLFRALTELDAKYIGDEIDPATSIEREHPVTLAWLKASHLMMLTTKLGFLDLFDYVPALPGEDVGQLIANAMPVGNLRFVSLDALRRMKRASGRTKDLLDLDHLPE
jgi:hypothetical protein